MQSRCSHVFAQAKVSKPSHKNLPNMAKLNRLNGWVALVAFSCVVLGTVVEDCKSIDLKIISLVRIIQFS